MARVPDWHTPEGCTAVSVLAPAAAIAHSFADCTSAVLGTARRSLHQMLSRAATSHSGLGILPAAAVPVRPTGTDRTSTGQGIAAAAVAAAEAAHTVSHTLHSALVVGTD